MTSSAYQPCGLSLVECLVANEFILFILYIVHQLDWIYYNYTVINVNKNNSEFVTCNLKEYTETIYKNFT